MHHHIALFRGKANGIAQDLGEHLTQCTRISLCADIFSLHCVNLNVLVLRGSADLMHRFGDFIIDPDLFTVEGQAACLEP